jgi:hypothetical protein
MSLQSVGVALFAIGLVALVAGFSMPAEKTASGTSCVGQYCSQVEASAPNEDRELLVTIGGAGTVVGGLLAFIGGVGTLPWERSATQSTPTTTRSASTASPSKTEIEVTGTVLDQTGDGGMVEKSYSGPAESFDDAERQFRRMAAEDGYKVVGDDLRFDRKSE